MGSRPMEPSDAAAIHVVIDSVSSQFFNLVEVRAPDQVGLLYRIEYKAGGSPQCTQLATLSTSFNGLTFIPAGQLPTIPTSPTDPGPRITIPGTFSLENA